MVLHSRKEMDASRKGDLQEDKWSMKDLFPLHPKRHSCSTVVVVVIIIFFFVTAFPFDVTDVSWCPLMTPSFTSSSFTTILVSWLLWPQRGQTRRHQRQGCRQRNKFFRQNNTQETLHVLLVWTTGRTCLQTLGHRDFLYFSINFWTKWTRTWVLPVFFQKSQKSNSETSSFFWFVVNNSFCSETAFGSTNEACFEIGCLLSK